MTRITLTVTGATAQAVVNGPLTSGLEKIPVTIKYDSAWDGLTKNLVCKSEPKSCSLVNTTRTIVNIGTTATIAHEVMRAGRVLYLGVEGYNSAGEAVISTTWAECGEICSGATADADPSADSTLSIWAQLQSEIEQVKKQAVTEAQVSAIISDYLGENLPAQNTALTAEQINALDGMFKVCAFTKEDVSAEYAAFCTAFGISDSGGEEEPDTPVEPDEPVVPEVTLTSISAAYDGGDVTVGTAVADLTGIVVTAYYSDGTSETVTGYTLSGEIAEGENTITVTYQGKTATFTVNGIAESTGENNGWTEAEAYTIEWTDGYGIDHNGSQGGGAVGAVFENSTRSVSGFLPCRGASALNVSGIYTNYGVFFYDENQEFVIRQIVADYTAPIPIPLNAYYVRVQCITTNTANATVTPIVLEKLTENIAWESGEYYCVEWEYGKQLNSTSGIEATHGSTTRNVSTYALCMGASTITSSFKLKMMVWFYDGDKNGISMIQFGTTSNSTSVPEGAVYFRADTCGTTDNMNGLFMFT